MNRRIVLWTAIVAVCFVGMSVAEAVPCTCDGDVDNNGTVNILDGVCIAECRAGDCSCCLSSCDVNCDGVVDAGDAGDDIIVDDSAWLCLFQGGSPEVCCAEPITGACCVGEVCEELEQAACTDAAGDYLGDDTVCSVDTCAPPPPPTGACCTGEVCDVREPDACVAGDGEHLGDGTVCAAETCAPPPTGACCVTLDCLIMTAAKCDGTGGAYQGDDTSCTEATCALPPCTCDPDVDGSGGLLQIQDWICIRECILGDCSCCVNSCDLNCDGVVNDLDAGPDPTVEDGSVFRCFWVGISAEICCAPRTTGACCIGETCKELEPDACASQGGQYLGDDTQCGEGTCAPPPPPTGACCTSEVCQELEHEACVGAGGEYLGDGTVCAADTCTPPPTGACCLTFDCVEATADDCASQGGAYNGDDTVCTASLCAPPPCTCEGDVDGSGLIQIQDWICILDCALGDCSCCVNSCDLNCDGLVNDLDAGSDPSNDRESIFYCLFSGVSPEICCAEPITGACCIGEVCEELEQDACVGAGGQYLGDDTVCTVDTCAPPPPPTGACCSGEVCDVREPDACVGAGGTYQGDNTVCTVDTCAPPPIGTCCLTFDCVEATADDCASQGGAYNGDDTVCTASLCAPPPCTCEGDVDGSGLIQIQDWLCILDCALGDCSCCVNSCDLNCDGLVNDLDAGSDPSNDRESIFYCLFSGVSPEICCAEPTRGACCVGEVCEELEHDACVTAGGEYHGDETVCTVDTCAPPPPPPPAPTGACCVTFDCHVATAEDCAAQSGAYQGDDTVCTESTCAPPPCTCDPDVDGSGGPLQIQDWICIRECIAGDCSCCVNSCDLNCDGVVNDLDAGPDPTVDDGSVFRCFWIGLSADVCCAEPTRGACCVGDHCLALTVLHCAEEGGTFLGDDSECTADRCASPTPGACCLDGECHQLTGTVCDAEGGEFLGQGTACTAGNCSGGGASGFATGLRNRYLSFATGNQPQVAAVRIVFFDLPAPFDLFNGVSMWVGAPREVGENGASSIPLEDFENFQSATLRCSPYVTDWQSVGTVFVHHADIIPGGTYRIEFVDSMLARVGSSMLVTMSRWGDLAGIYGASGWWEAPDGSIDIGGDVLGAIRKFAGAPSAMRKVRVDVEPATPDQVINIADILYIIRAFQGLPYPFSPGEPPCGG